VVDAFKGTTSFDDSAGNTVINIQLLPSSLNAASGATTVAAHPYGQVYSITNNGTGTTTVNILASTTAGMPVDGVELKFLGSSTIATTVNGSTGAADSNGALPFQTDLVNTGSVFINANNSEQVLFSTGAGTGVATLFGGTGTDIDAGVGGLIIGGSHTAAGLSNNILFASNSQSTTLVGGGAGDNLVSFKSGNLLIAGPGSETLYSEADTVQGVGVTTLIGGQTLASTLAASAITTMNGLAGGNTFMTGAGIASISAVQAGGGNTFMEGVSGKNTAGITGFLTGTDTISLKNPAGGTYTLETTGAPGSGQVELAPIAGGGSVVTFGDGTTWTFSTTVNSTDFH